MVHKILKSRIHRLGDDFGAIVSAHAAELHNWHAHMAQVAIDNDRYSKNSELDPLKRHAPFPQPSAHPDVDAAVRRIEKPGGGLNFVPDFEIVDDSPTAAQVLLARKQEIFSEINRAELAAAEQVSPAAKRRHLEFVSNDARARGEDATSADQAAISDQEACRAKLDSIARHGARLMHDVHDMTASELDAWTMPPFPV